jgi:hypothetical protein
MLFYAAAAIRYSRILNSLEISSRMYPLDSNFKAKYHRLQFHEEICHLKYSLNLTQSDSHRFYK